MYSLLKYSAIMLPSNWIQNSYTILSFKYKCNIKESQICKKLKITGSTIKEKPFTFNTKVKT